MRTGLHGTPTMEIAKAAGISQAYLFRLFPTKAELFMALVERCNARVQRTFEDAAAAARGVADMPSGWWIRCSRRRRSTPSAPSPPLPAPCMPGVF